MTIFKKKDIAPPDPPAPPDLDVQNKKDGVTTPPPYPIWIGPGDPLQASAPVIAPSAVAPVQYFTDEGVRYEWLAHPNSIVNFATDSYDAHRRELHLKGKTFSHVSETVEGRWTYRAD